MEKTILDSKIIKPLVTSQNMIEDNFSAITATLQDSYRTQLYIPYK